VLPFKPLQLGFITRFRNDRKAVIATGDDDFFLFFLIKAPAEY
jgi:hypothetical protein